MQEKEESTEYRLRVIAQHMEYTIVSFDQKDLDSHDTVFRGILYEICKFYKEYNIELYIDELTRIDVNEIVPNKMPLVYVKSKVSEAIETSFSENEPKIVSTQLILTGNKIKLSIRAQGKRPKEIEASVKDIENNLQGKGRDFLVKKPRKEMDKARQDQLKTRANKIIGPKHHLRQLGRLNHISEEPINDMLFEEKECTQYHIESARLSKKAHNTEANERENEVIA